MFGAIIFLLYCGFIKCFFFSALGPIRTCSFRKLEPCILYWCTHLLHHVSPKFLRCPGLNRTSSRFFFVNSQSCHRYFLFHEFRIGSLELDFYLRSFRFIEIQKFSQNQLYLRLRVDRFFLLRNFLFFGPFEKEMGEFEWNQTINFLMNKILLLFCLNIFITGKSWPLIVSIVAN